MLCVGHGRAAQAAPVPARDAAPAIRTLRLEGGGPLGARLAAPEDRAQLLVTGRSAAGAEEDLTRRARFEVIPRGIAAVDTRGLVTPLREGRGLVRASVGSLRSAAIPLLVTGLSEPRPVSFQLQVVPVLTRLGCNGGGCHGRSDGRGGFRLSLFGFEPADDQAWLRETGRRTNPSDPESSLLLRKPSLAVPHGGGLRLPHGSPEYRLLARWIAEGARPTSAVEPTVRSLEIRPSERLLRAGAAQQVAVLARLSDGTVRDVTAAAQFETNDAGVASVSDSGLITGGEAPGVAAVMARFQTHVGVTRALRPAGPAYTPEPAGSSPIDALVWKQLGRLGIPASSPADPGTFIRRVTLDLAGRLPTPSETEEFCADTAPGAVGRVVDRLLASGDYADWSASRWSALLRNRRGAPNDDPAPTRGFHAWLRESFAGNRPFDSVVRDLLTATGTPDRNPAVLWYREVRDPPALVEDAAQLFLGQRLACARCHHHPQEQWSQQDYHGLAAFFSRLAVTQPPAPPRRKPGEPVPPSPPALIVGLKDEPAVTTHPRTGLAIYPTPLGAAPVRVGDRDPRVALADWIAEPANPYFARAVVNRVWKQLFGRGLAEPEDDLRASNPPSNPELLDFLARQFVASHFDLKALLRLLATSRAYRLSAVPVAGNSADRQCFSRFLPRRMPAEVLLDAVDRVTGTQTAFRGLASGTRAIQLPDNQAESYFLTVFGRPDFASACECERSGGASLAQALHMLNSPEVLAKVRGERARALAQDPRPHAARLRELYLDAVSRPPTPAEEALFLPRLEDAGEPLEAYADVIWAVINSKGFLFIR
jgi:hypothetical protein